MSDPNSEVNRIRISKQALKKKLIKLSFYEKIRRIIVMQRIAADLAKDKADRIVWNQ